MAACIVSSSTFHANWGEGGGNTDCPTDYSSWYFTNNGQSWGVTSEIVMECQAERKFNYCKNQVTGSF